MATLDLSSMLLPAFGETTVTVREKNFLVGIFDHTTRHSAERPPFPKWDWATVGNARGTEAQKENFRQMVVGLINRRLIVEVEDERGQGYLKLSDRGQAIAIHFKEMDARASRQAETAAAAAADAAEEAKDRAGKAS